MAAPDGLLPESPDPVDPDVEESADSFPRARIVSFPAGVSCSREFAAAVQTLALRRGAAPSALAAAALLLAGSLGNEPDPGPGDASLDIHVPAGTDAGGVRRALALAVALAQGKRPLREAERVESRLQSLEYRNKALRGALERLAFQPLDGGITDVREAARLFGFVNEWCFDEALLTKRFRELAPVYHPDTGVVGCRERMAQLIDARNLLVRHVRTAYASGRWRRA